MEWLLPKDNHVVYEALSAVADDRIERRNNSFAVCKSTTPGKVYSLSFDLEKNEFMSNDNLAFARGEVSYPMIALLIHLHVIDVDPKILQHFAGIPWKKINTKNRNDYMKSVNEFLAGLEEKGIDTGEIISEVDRIYAFVCTTKFQKRGKQQFPARIK